jgi:hypothetical protein
MRVMARWASAELGQALARLSAQQANGVVRIVQAELEGRSLSSLLDCPGQICTSTTFYGSGRRRGWKGKPEFVAALELARRDYREWMLEHGTGEAMAVLASTAPDAARALRQRVAGDAPALAALELALTARESNLRINAALGLGKTGLPDVVPALQEALQREKEVTVREALQDALGMIAAGAARDVDAAESVLDRAAVETAVKSQRAFDLSGFDQALSRVYGDDVQES